MYHTEFADIYSTGNYKVLITLLALITFNKYFFLEGTNYYDSLFLFNKSLVTVINCFNKVTVQQQLQVASSISEILITEV